MLLEKYAVWSTFLAWNQNTEDMTFKMFGPVCMNILLVDFPPIEARRSWMPSRQRLRLHRPAPPHGAPIDHLLDIILPATSLVTMVTSSLVTRLLLAALHHLPSQHSTAVANQSGSWQWSSLIMKENQKKLLKRNLWTVSLPPSPVLSSLTDLREIRWLQIFCQFWCCCELNSACRQVSTGL